jgi:hypothetical protein
MAWEWSHASEAYSYANEQLRKLSRDELVEIYNEWAMKIEFNADPSDFTDEALADIIWAHASGYEHGRTCDNGGGALWLCPYGCHTVDLDDMPDDWTPDE